MRIILEVPASISALHHIASPSDKEPVRHALDCVFFAQAKSQADHILARASNGAIMAIVEMERSAISDSAKTLCVKASILKAAAKARRVVRIEIVDEAAHYVVYGRDADGAPLTIQRVSYTDIFWQRSNVVADIEHTLKFASEPFPMPPLGLDIALVCKASAALEVLCGRDGNTQCVFQISAHAHPEKEPVRFSAHTLSFAPSIEAVQFVIMPFRLRTT